MKLIPIILLILLILLILSLFFLTIKKTEFFQNMTPKSEFSIVNKYLKNQNEINNVDTVLNRPVLPGKNIISKVRPYNSIKIKDVNRFDDKKLLCLTENHPLRKKIIKYQPYMYGKSSKIVDYYGSMFYRDWRYPLKPISLKFLANPIKYIKENPTIYPSYVIIRELGI